MENELQNPFIGRSKENLEETLVIYRDRLIKGTIDAKGVKERDLIVALESLESLKKQIEEYEASISKYQSDLELITQALELLKS